MDYMPGPEYRRAAKALETAHNACFKHPDRDVLGMSHGPFSGVNEALRIILKLEADLKECRSQLDRKV